MRLFGTSGIRGVVGKELTTDLCRDVGRALGAVLPPGSRVCIATDTRLSRELIRDAVVAGLISSGTNVTDFGILPTPALAFLTRDMGFNTGIMITASHNPPEYNGIKVFNQNTIAYSVQQEDEIEETYRQKRFRAAGSPGKLTRDETAQERYLARLRSLFSGSGLNRELKIVVDPGNGAASEFASRLFSSLGLNIVPLNDTPDGRSPGRPSEPTGETLKGTIDFLRNQQADIAVCFDGDADRVVFCDQEGFLGFSEMVAFLSRIVVERSGKKTVAATIEVGKILDLALEDLGARVARGKIGDVYLAHLVREHDAALGVEDIGVYILPEMGWYPESMGAALTLLSHIKSADEIRTFLRRLPRFFSAKGKVPCLPPIKEPTMEHLSRLSEQEAAEWFGGGPPKINLLDGIRFDFHDSWVLIRPSGTEPVIRVTAEALDESQVKTLTRAGIAAVEAALRRIAG